MSFDKIVLHIGYHKTATSWLQKKFFENDELPINALARYEDRAKWLTEILKPDYTYCPEVLKGYINENYKRGSINVLSIERLSGYPITGGYDSYTLAHRLHDLIPDAKVIISTREPKSMIKAAYIEYLKANGAETLPELLKTKRNVFLRKPTFNLAFFKYQHLINTYDKLFCSSNVLLLPIELLQDKPSLYIELLASFMGISLDTINNANLEVQEKVNSRFSMKDAYLNRLKSRLFGSDNNQIELIKSKTIERLFDMIVPKLPLNYGQFLENEIEAVINQIDESEFKQEQEYLQRRVAKQVAEAL